MNDLENYSKSIFDSIRHVDDYGNEYWLARELQLILNYKEWRKFEGVIDKAKIACKNSNVDTKEQFVDADKLSINVNGGRRRVKDYRLSRYACYLIAQNGDSRKEVIALGQTYFAVQTRKQEIIDFLDEDKKRLSIRKKVKEGNLGLNRTAVNSGVKNLAEFHNAGYKGLYNGETAADIFKRKKLRYREDILDNMCSSELAANLFRITQTDDKLKREKVDNEYMANSVHFEIGKKVRKAIEDMGGTMPENFTNPDKSIKKINKE